MEVVEFGLKSLTEVQSINDCSQSKKSESKSLCLSRSYM